MSKSTKIFHSFVVGNTQFYYLKKNFSPEEESLTPTIGFGVP